MSNHPYTQPYPAQPTTPSKPKRRWLLTAVVGLASLFVGVGIGSGGQTTAETAPDATTTITVTTDPEPAPTITVTETATHAEPTEAAAPEPADDEAEPVTEPEQPVSAGGTRANPHPLGTTIASDDWEVTVTSFIPDATQDVLDANQFNEAPEEGHTYALVGISVTRLGPESGSTLEVGVDYVTAEGNVVSPFDAFAVGPEELSFEELFQGASTSGNVVLMIPDGGAGTVRVSPGWFTDEAFFATS